MYYTVIIGVFKIEIIVTNFTQTASTTLSWKARVGYSNKIICSIIYFKISQQHTEE